jgi:hypothetical protein
MVSKERYRYDSTMILAPGVLAAAVVSSLIYFSCVGLLCLSVVDATMTQNRKKPADFGSADRRSFKGYYFVCTYHQPYIEHTNRMGV